VRCHQCRALAPAGARFCPACGAQVSAADATTHTGDGTPEAPPPHSPGRTSAPGWLDASAIDHGRFAPGTILQDRYRMVGLLGRGGMGEVYRADDLRLGQPVALKFLPADLSRDPARLAQFHAEVRTARDVSHPNVCRVYDIGDAGAELFLTMELVDGEDLAASLRRIGRFPEDRAVEIAREMGAGLAAAHGRGVIHRDLKPSNIMIDGAGRVRIMDFGLAVVGPVDRPRAGTPAYMAPEQLAGREVTARSDIYAYGLVLYELFTGRRAQQGATVAELVLAHGSGEVTPPRSIVPALDPRIERAILRCLAPDPAERPATALAAAALLPGGDPLAAAIAAGQTPSPEMVAAAGETTAPPLSARQGVVAMAALAGLLAAVGALADRGSVAGRSEMRRSAPVLAEYARQARAAAGIGAAPAHEAWGFDYDRDALRWYGAAGGPGEQWARLAGAVPAIRFWHRSSPRPIAPLNPLGAISPRDPPLGAGETMVELDASARLLRLQASPRLDDIDPTVPGGGAVEWSPLFRSAGLDFLAFAPARRVPTPPVFADDARAWTGMSPIGTDTLMHVEAASLAGQPVWFQVVGPWRAPVPDSLPGLATAAIVASAGLSALLVLATVWLAIANVREDRADRDGAFRVGTWAFGIYMLRWLFFPAHQGDPAAESVRLFDALGYGLLFGVVLGGAYLGLEPFVRRHWPHALVGWTRLLAGRWRDPLVGRDVLLGLCAGLAGAMVTYTYAVAPGWLGRPAPSGWLLSLAPAEGLAMAVSGVLFNVNWSLLNGLLAMFIVAVIRRWIRPGWAVAALAMVAFATLGDPETHIAFGTPGLFATLGLMTLPGIVVLFRYGLLAGVASALSSNLTANMVFTLDPSNGYFQACLLQAGLIVALGAIGWRLSRQARAA
jgi:serine/threonine-protein kinase